MVGFLLVSLLLLGSVKLMLFPLVGSEILAQSAKISRLFEHVTWKSTCTQVRDFVVMIELGHVHTWCPSTPAQNGAVFRH